VCYCSCVSSVWVDEWHYNSNQISIKLLVYHFKCLLRCDLPLNFIFFFSTAFRIENLFGSLLSFALLCVYDLALFFYLWCLYSYLLLYLSFHRIEISILYIDQTRGEEMIELLAHFCFEWIYQVQFIYNALLIRQLPYWVHKSCVYLTLENIDEGGESQIFISFILQLLF
jgi:hypothetical protein